ncbi:PREDICTED: F-box/LRR-repeat protein 3 isoform X2 [Tarenaya hassleriana]|uniref:F-box/LRR-repeat protein 3 isoform X2 n=1 Tax=Tarenaya hassleriana TaxID=28532 RepID=UPI00053C59F4|nr:PREDICTED: F-box/LRR-repeat protein 3 isoform X2 [Tarenaya hassleriana]
MSLSPSILSVLSEDLLVRVYGFLDPTGRKAWRLVCRDFLRIDSLSRTSIRVLRIELFTALLLRYPNLSSVDLSVCPRVDDSVVLRLALNGPALRSLNLSRATGVGARGMETVARACQALERVDVSHCWRFGDWEAAALSVAAGLRELRMDKCLGLSDVGLVRIAVGCSKLEKISLKWCMEISDLGIDLLCKKCRDLKSLDVSYLKITNDSICSISSLPKLEVLLMVCCPLITDAGLQFLENGSPSLQEIDVTRCERLSLSGLISVLKGHPDLRQFRAGHTVSEISTSFLPYIRAMKNLETIIIDGACISDSFLRKLSSNCRFLTEIGLSKCIDMTDMGVMALVRGCVNLRTLNMSCCGSITDLALSAVVESCQYLQILKLESCNMITEKGLRGIGHCSKLLQELDLTDCCGINDRGLEYISRCSNLLRLKLGLCTNVSDKGLFHIGSNCTKLLELDLYRCSGIGDEGLAALSRGCKSLNRLNLSYCDELTDTGVEHIGQLEQLGHLELRGIKKITGTGLATISLGCKKLVYLDLKLCEKIDDSGFWALAYFSRNLRQINLSYCSVSDTALCMVMSNLTRLQDMDLVHLSNATVEGFELGLRACCTRLKKLKLLAPLRFLLSSELLERLHARGCRIRWA